MHAGNAPRDNAPNRATRLRGALGPMLRAIAALDLCR
tara:strand:- start:142 stop:252 length:111 start_codon:yes stop_codon:yes gene_type:complete